MTASINGTTHKITPAALRNTHPGRGITTTTPVVRPAAAPTVAAAPYTWTPKVREVEMVPPFGARARSWSLDPEERRRLRTESILAAVNLHGEMETQECFCGEELTRVLADAERIYAWITESEEKP